MKRDSITEWREILNSELPVLINFYFVGEFSLYNRIELLSSVKKIAGSTVCILKVKIQRNDSLALKYQLDAQNTLILFRKGEICWRKTGTISKMEILKQLALHC